MVWRRGGRVGKSEVSNAKNLLGSAAQQPLISNPGCTGLEISGGMAQAALKKQCRDGLNVCREGEC